MELTAILGLILGLGGILLGHLFEGGQITSLVQITAFTIVFCGTFGATLLSHRAEDVRLAIRYFVLALRGPNLERRKSIAKEVVDCVGLARKDSLLAIEPKLKSLPTPFMKNVFRYVVDGIDVDIIKDVFESKISIIEAKQLKAAKVWADAGGFAPTIGIVGAVLGLIHVMGNLTNTAELGKGIAVAFVATIYGVGSANLIFLPIANKIKELVEFNSDENEMILQGAISLMKGEQTFVIEEKLRSYTQEVEPG